MSVLRHRLQICVSTDAIKRSRKLAAELTARRIDHHRPIIRQLIRQVVVAETGLAIYVDWTALCSKLGVVPDPSDEELLTIEMTARLACSGPQTDSRSIHRLCTACFAAAQ